MEGGGAGGGVAGDWWTDEWMISGWMESVIRPVLIYTRVDAFPHHLYLNHVHVCPHFPLTVQRQL